MTSPTSSQSIEEKLYSANSIPPRAEFLTDLRARLASQPPRAISFGKRTGLVFRRPVWVTIIAILLLLAIALAAIGPQRVIAAFRQLLGYIPGVGIVEQGAPMRVLAAPVKQTRDGITLTVTEAYLTTEKTILIYTIENVPFSALSHDENVVGCSDTGRLVLPSGITLKINNGWGSGNQANNFYSPIPENINEARFILPCIQGTLPGKAPENWEIPLHFMPAPPDLKAVPIIDLPTPISTTAQPAQPTQPQLTTSPAYGIEMVLDQFIPLNDGYYLIGHTRWTDNRISSAFPGGWAMKAFDTGGQEIPLEPVNIRDIGLNNLQPDQWVYRLYGNAFNGPLILRTTLVGVEFTQPVQLELDPTSYGFDGSNAQLGKVWKIDSIRLDVPGIQARVVQLKYMQQGAEKGFEIGIEAEPGLQSLPFSLRSAVTGGRGATGGGSNRPAPSGLILSYMLSDGQMSSPLSLSASSADLVGVWETTWNPPSGSSNLTPTPVSQACLTMERWKQAIKKPIPLPGGLQGRVLLSRDAWAPNPSLFIANLDGSGEQGLAFGNGSLSPDGSKLVYDDRSGNIVVLDLKGGQKAIRTSGPNDYNPIWSPDGKQIAFIRLGDNLQIFAMNADGSNLRPVTSAANPLQIAWSPDSSQILYWVQGAADRTGIVRLVDASSGIVSDLFDVQTDAPSPAFSPDGEWIVYLDRVVGRMANGLYLARPDGSQRRLVVQLDYWPVSKAIWSPDGKWIAFSVLNTDLFTPTSTAGFLNVETCQVIPFTELDGAIQSWVNP
jgi:hypothetical protein